MKKLYFSPEMETVRLEQTGMLCVSGEISGEATEPAHSRLFDDEEFSPEP